MTEEKDEPDQGHFPVGGLKGVIYQKKSDSPEAPSGLEGFIFEGLKHFPISLSDDNNSKQGDESKTVKGNIQPADVDVTKTSCENKPYDNDRIIAFYGNGVLAICLEGKIPDPGYKIAIEKSMISVWPPEFVVKLCRLPGYWPQVVVPYKIVVKFCMNEYPETIKIHFKDTVKEVDVNLLPVVRPALMNIADDKAEKPKTVTGVSFNFSLQEALDNALGKLRESVNSELVSGKVVDIDISSGGFTGFDVLSVTVQVTKP